MRVSILAEKYNMSIDPSDRLEHILDETIFLIQIRKDLDSIEDIINDEILKRAIIRSLEIIGEATKNLPENIRQQNPQVDWKNIARMRDNLIHRYFGINYDIVWEVLEDRIPQLHQTVLRILQSIYREQYLYYKQQVSLENNDSVRDKTATDIYEPIDLAIAKNIINEYSDDFRDTAIAKIERILSYSERSLQLKSNNNSIESYLKSIIESI